MKSALGNIDLISSWKRLVPFRLVLLSLLLTCFFTTILSDKPRHSGIQMLRAKKIPLNNYCGITLTSAVAYVCGTSGTHSKNFQQIRNYREKRRSLNNRLCSYNLFYYPNGLVSLCCCQRCNGRMMMNFCAI